MFNTIQVFGKPPSAGKVKTRLIPDLGADGACALHREMLFNTIEIALTGSTAEVELWLSDTDIEFDSLVTEKYQLSIFRQNGTDLGCRMYNAMDSALQRADKVLLIGSDCPLLGSQNFSQAFSALEKFDIVFIPALDGGYVLVAAKKISPSWFANIDWGSDKVMQQSLEAIKLDKSVKVGMLTPPLRDLDTYEDYLWFKKRQLF